MSNMDQYPHFADGDVLIEAPTGDTWRLHSHILSQFCPTFRELLQKNRGHVSKKHKTDAKPSAQWKFNMTVIDQYEFYVDFRPVDLSAKEAFRLPVSLNGKGGKPEYLVSYDNLFRCFYNLDPDLDQDGGPNSLTHRSVHLVQAAERIDALAPVRRIIESHLLGLGQVLWQRVVSSPSLYADLAIRLESPAIFKEAMVHVIGTWSRPEGMKNMDVSKHQNPATHAKTIKEIAERKVQELDEWKEEVELKLIHHTPDCLKKEMIGDRYPGRADYANDIYRWQALTLVRQHITTALFHKQGRLADDGGAAFYRQLNNGGTAYLRPKALEVFLQDFPMTKKGEQKFEQAMTLIKEQFQSVTAELMVNNGQPFAVNAPPLGYLTLGYVDEEDFPWVVEGKKMKQEGLFISELPNLNRAPLASMNQLPASPRRPQPVAIPGNSPLKNSPKHLATNRVNTSANSSVKLKRDADEAFGTELQEE